MSETRPYDAYFTSDVIPFHSEIALLGANTNGAAPERIYGLFIEGNICEAKGEVSQGYWLRATTEPANDDGSHPKGWQNVIFADTPQDVEMILSAIVNSSIDPMSVTYIPAKLSGWHSHGQIRFNEETPEDCVYELGCKVRATSNGFNLTLQHKMNHGKADVNSISAALGPVGIDVAMSTVAKLHNWSDEHSRNIQKATGLTSAPSL